MANIELGAQAPDFTLKTDGNSELSLQSLRGKNVVLYFYPKDSTPGCTTEAQDFRDLYPEFVKLGTEIVGASKDSVKRHDNFKAKNDLPFPLVADLDGTLCDDYGVWVLKKLYGREYMGIQRATFLIDADGLIQKIWPKVKVKGHAEDVLKAVRELS